MGLIYDRKNNKIIEDRQYGSNILNFLYNNVFGRILLKICITPIFSKILGAFSNTRFSKNRIKKFVKQNNINLDEYEDVEYKSFNDFFIRKKKKENLIVNKDKDVFISPADSKLLIYRISENLQIEVKNIKYTLEEILDLDNCKTGKDENINKNKDKNKNNINLSEYNNGYVFVFRLSVDDYHRYCFIDNGKLLKSKYIKGKLHTVSSISEKEKIYSQNSRVVTFLETENFGELIYIEVGAILVGKIINHKVNIFKKGDEKGYFEQGGSTIVVLIKDKVKIDDDILDMSEKLIETKVKYGERIGKLK